MTRADLDEVAHIHLEAFPNFFLTFLGKEFIFRLYGAVLEDNSGLALVAEREGTRVGFVAGSLQPQGFYRRLVSHHWLVFAWAVRRAAIKKPKIVLRLVRQLSIPDDYRLEQGIALLMSIAVMPDAQGCGVGRELVQAFIDQVSLRHARQVVLTTDRDNNFRVNKFYQDFGFQLLGSFITPEGRAMNRYIIETGNPLPE